MFAVWLVGFVCGVGYIVAGKADVNLRLKPWSTMMLGIAAIGGALALGVYFW